jgi:hypothetical protein
MNMLPALLVFFVDGVLYQGTTSVAPKTAEMKGRALAPGGCFSRNSPNIQPLSASGKIMP